MLRPRHVAAALPPSAPRSVWRVGPSAVRAVAPGCRPRQCGFGSNHAPRRQARLIPPASSVRCWCRCRPTARPMIETAPWRPRCASRCRTGRRCCAPAGRCASPSPRHRRPVRRASGAARDGRPALPSPSRGGCCGCCIRRREAAQAGRQGPARRSRRAHSRSVVFREGVSSISYARCNPLIGLGQGNLQKSRFLQHRGIKGGLHPVHGDG